MFSYLQVKNIWFITYIVFFSIYFQSSRDHPGLAFLWGHRHVVLGLCNSRAVPGLAPLPGGLRVWSGNTKRFLEFCHPTHESDLLCSSVYVHPFFALSRSLSASVFGRVGCISNPPDSPWWFLRTLPVYLNRCHRATCPISAAPVLQSKTSQHFLLPISQTRLSGKTSSKLCSIAKQACPFFYTSPKSLQSVSFTSLESILDPWAEAMCGQFLELLMFD